MSYREDRGPGEVGALLLPHRERIEDWLKPESGQKRRLRLTKAPEPARADRARQGPPGA
jgi:hypothetical protein